MNKIRYHFSNKIILEIAVIFTIFTVSVIIRWPAMNWHLSDNDDNMTAHVLLTIQSWRENGTRNFNFVPSITLGGVSNKFIDNFTNPYTDKNRKSVADGAGNHFYVSFPPFAFIAPYLIFQLFSLKSIPINLIFFNLFLQFIAAVFIYGIVKLLTNNARFNASAILAAGVYILTPGNMWYYSNAYFTETAVQPFLIASIFILIFLFRKQSSISKITENILVASMGLFLFITAYTEWLGFFSAVTLFFYGLFQFKKSNLAKKILFISLIASLAALALIIYQFSSIAGWSEFIRVFTDRFISRSGFGSGILRFRTFIWMVSNFKNYFSPAIILLFSMFIAVFVISKEARNIFQRLEWLLVYFLLLPPVLHYVLLLQNNSVHHFAPIKFAALLAILIGLLYHKFSNYFSSGIRSVQERYKIYAFWFLVLIMLPLVNSQYFRNFAAPSEPDRYFNAGQIIKNIAKPEEVVFLIFENNPVYSPDYQLIYYAQRNLQMVRNKEEASLWLYEHGRNRGINFYLQGFGNHFVVEGFERVQLIES